MQQKNYTDELIFKIKERKNIPSHIAVIMDGNGRWAKKQNKNRVFGHNEGVNSARDIIESANDIGVKYLTLYTFSKENWNRPALEVNALMSLLVKTILDEIDSLNEKNILVKVIGNLDDLPKEAKQSMVDAIADTQKNTGMQLNIALSYSGRDEIVNAVNQILKEKKYDNIDENIFQDYLYTKNMPDPELLIRTGGEMRVSNFLLWQIAYTEMFVTETFWPDFSKKEFFEAVLSYQSRERRFGKTTEQIIGKT